MYIASLINQQQSMNRDEGSYQLSHAYDRFLGTSSSRLLMKVCDRDRNVNKSKNWLRLILNVYRPNESVY